MSLSEEIFEKAKTAGKVGDGSRYFSVIDKKAAKLPNGDEMVVDVPNGDHRVKVLSEKIDTGKDFNGKDAKQLQLVILDNGTKKEWNLPLVNQDGTLYFLIEKLKEIKYLDGEEFLVRAKKLKSGNYGKEIIRLSKGEEFPTIQLDEDIGDGIMGEGEGTPEGDGIPLADIPF
jgi:hypothetical protein